MMNAKYRTTWPGLLAAATLLGVLLPHSSALAQKARFVPEALVSHPSTGLLVAFWILGGLTLLGALITITRRNPVVAAVSLVGTLFCTGGLYLLLHATFLAAMQVMVYAGAIMVLFVFVIMAVKDPEREETGLKRGTVTKLIGVVAIILLFARVFTVVGSPEVRGPRAVPETFGQAASLGKMFFGLANSCKVEFKYRRTGDATQVDLVGDFPRWKSPIPMYAKQDSWRTVVSLQDGQKVRYGFMLDKDKVKPDPAVTERAGQRSVRTIKCPVSYPNYLFPFEAISILLLTAIVGAVVVSRRRRLQDDGQDPGQGGSQ